MIFRTLTLAFLCASLLACNNQVGADAGAGPVGNTSQATLPEGMMETEPGGTYGNLNAQLFAAMMERPDAVVLDVRTPGEITGGMIDGALHIDYRSPGFAARVAELDPTKTYLVYCASGGRSGKTSQLLIDNGATEVYNLEGGYAAWKKTQK